MNKKVRKLKFTLIEVTVAFGVLAILIMFLMQFLNTAQTSWNFAEKRARAYADSRTAFDFIERALNSVERGSTVNVGTSLKFDGVRPYGKRGYGNVEFSLTGGELKLGSDSLIENVVSFNVQKTNAANSKSYVIRLVMFGSEADYDEYNEITDADDKKEFLSQHGFCFVRLVNLQ